MNTEEGRKLQWREKLKRISAPKKGQRESERD